MTIEIFSEQGFVPWTLTQQDVSYGKRVSVVFGDEIFEGYKQWFGVSYERAVYLLDNGDSVVHEYPNGKKYVNGVYVNVEDVLTYYLNPNKIVFSDEFKGLDSRVNLTWPSSLHFRFPELIREADIENDGNILDYKNKFQRYEPLYGYSYGATHAVKIPYKNNFYYGYSNFTQNIQQNLNDKYPIHYWLLSGDQLIDYLLNGRVVRSYVPKPIPNFFPQNLPINQNGFNPNIGVNQKVTSAKYFSDTFQMPLESVEKFFASPGLVYEGYDGKDFVIPEFKFYKLGDVRREQIYNVVTNTVETGVELGVYENIKDVYFDNQQLLKTLLEFFRYYKINENLKTAVSVKLNFKKIFVLYDRSYFNLSSQVEVETSFQFETLLKLFFSQNNRFPFILLNQVKNDFLLPLTFDQDQYGYIVPTWALMSILASYQINGLDVRQHVALTDSGARISADLYEQFRQSYAETVLSGKHQAGEIFSNLTEFGYDSVVIKSPTFNPPLSDKFKSIAIEIYSNNTVPFSARIPLYVHKDIALAVREVYKKRINETNEKAKEIENKVFEQIMISGFLQMVMGFASLAGLLGTSAVQGLASLIEGNFTYSNLIGGVRVANTFELIDFNVPKPVSMAVNLFNLDDVFDDLISDSVAVQDVVYFNDQLLIEVESSPLDELAAPDILEPEIPTMFEDFDPDYVDPTDFYAPVDDVVFNDFDAFTDADFVSIEDVNFGEFDYDQFYQDFPIYYDESLIDESLFSDFDIPANVFTPDDEFVYFDEGENIFDASTGDALQVTEETYLQNLYVGDDGAIYDMANNQVLPDLSAFSDEDVSEFVSGGNWTGVVGSTLLSNLMSGSGQSGATQPANPARPASTPSVGSTFRLPTFNGGTVFDNLLNLVSLYGSYRIASEAVNSPNPRPYVPNVPTSNVGTPKPPTVGVPITRPNGDVVVRNPDGSVTTTSLNGQVTTTRPNIASSDNKTLLYIGGAVTLVALLSFANRKGK